VNVILFSYCRARYSDFARFSNDLLAADFVLRMVTRRVLYIYLASFVFASRLCFCFIVIMFLLDKLISRA
jgi:hypothetical protein